MLSDIRFALRAIGKRPGFSAVAALILALGIGGNTAIFSVVEGTLLRPLPFSHPEQLVRIFEAQKESGVRAASVNLSDQTVQRWREYSHNAFQDIGAASGGVAMIGLSDGSPVQTVPAARVTTNFFSVLGLLPARGRTFLETEGRDGAPVVLISDDFWRNNLNSRAGVLGSVILIDGTKRTIIGVMPRWFRHPYRANIWLPLSLPAADYADRVNHYLYGVGRLRPGIMPKQAEAALQQICAAINQADPTPGNPRAAYLSPLRESFVMDLRPKVLVIVGGALCAMLIAAANFAGLLLSRVVEREGEFALRAALGASRRQIISQELVHSLLIALIGTAFGLLIAYWVTPTLLAMSPEGSDATGSAMREFDYNARLDLPVFGFAAGIMALTGFGFGLLPAAHASRIDVRNAINSVSRSVTLDRKSSRLLGSFVVIELAVAAALLTLSVATTQFFWKLVNEPWGFETQDRVAFSVTLPDQFFPTAIAKQNALNAMLEQLRALPGVSSATVTSPAPMDASWNLMPLNPEGAPAPEPRGLYFSYSRVVAPGYFESIGQPLLQGREFVETDGPDSPLVCVVTEGFVRRFWPNESPIGKRVKWGRLDDPRPWFTVVGVVADMKAIADPQDGEVMGMVAKPFAQMLAHGTAPLDDITFVLHTSTKSVGESVIRGAIARANSHMTPYNLLSLETAAAQSRSTERFIFVLMSSFGVLGLLLSAVGLYGLLALQVACRRREFGIRSAFGATAAHLIQLVAKQGARLFFGGLIAGTFTTLAIVRLVQSQWAEMPVLNPLACIGGGLVLAIAVTIACWLPARRATLVDPVQALRTE